KLRGGAAGADDADADAVVAKIFRHATGKTDDAPFRGAIDAAAGEGVFAGERADIDDVAGAAADHGGHDGARNKEDALQIGVVNAVPISFGLFVSGAEEADPGVIDE